MSWSWLCAVARCLSHHLRLGEAILACFLAWRLEPGNPHAVAHLVHNNAHCSRRGGARKAAGLENYETLDLRNVPRAGNGTSLQAVGDGAGPGRLATNRGQPPKKTRRPSYERGGGRTWGDGTGTRHASK